MFERLSRTAMGALTESVSSVVPARALGFARSLADGRVSVLYSSGHGLSAHVVDQVDVPAVMYDQRVTLLVSESEPMRAKTFMQRLR